jgi:DNA-binding NtrC family response regulator
MEFNNATLREIEKTVIVQRLEDFKGNRTMTAKSLEIGLRTLQRKLRSCGLSEYLLADVWLMRKRMGG